MNTEQIRNNLNTFNMFRLELLNIIIEDIYQLKNNIDKWETFYKKYNKINTSIKEDNYISIKVFKNDYNELYNIKINFFCWRCHIDNIKFDELAWIILKYI